MSPVLHEAHVEHLLGRRVRDPHGEIVGRIEEFRIADVDGETVVVEFHVGPEALLERLGGAALKLPFLDRLPFDRRRYRIPWRDMDLSDPDHPRARLSMRELERVQPDRS